MSKPDWIKQVKFASKQFTEMQAGLIVNFYKEPMQNFRADSFLARDLGTAQTRISGFFIFSASFCKNGKKQHVLEQRVLASSSCYEMLTRLGNLPIETERQVVEAQAAFFNDIGK